MAMRPRTFGYGYGTLRQSTRPMYEDFQPTSEWKEEQRANVLQVYLPGFRREQIKITQESSRIIRISGERLLVDNKRSRINQTFSIPENCDIGRIQAKFERETLTITMPKKIIARVDPKEEAKTTQEAPKSEEPAGEPESQKFPDETPPKAPSLADVEKQKDEKSAQPSSSQKGQEETPPKATSTIGREKPTIGKRAEALSPQEVASQPTSQKGEDETPPKAPSLTDVEKKKDEKSTAQPSSPQKASSKPMSQKSQEETSPKATSTIGSEKPTNGKRVDALSPQEVASQPKSPKGKDEAPTKASSTMDTAKPRDEKTEGASKESADKKAIEKKESSEVNAKHPESEKAEKVMEKTIEKERKESAMAETESVIQRASAEKLKVTGTAKQAVRSLTMGMSDQRQLLVNVGAAVLVIVAIGAYTYISFTYGSWRKPKK